MLLGTATVSCLLLTSCIGWSHTRGIGGHIFALGGPTGSRRLVAGTVQISSGVELTVEVGEDGTFYAAVPEGRYDVSGVAARHTRGTCSAPVSPVTVLADSTATVDIICQMR